MPRTTKRLTAKTTQHAPPGKHSDGGGLYLVVKPSGTRSWVARLTIDAKQKDIGIGGWPTVSLAEARQRVAEMRADVRDGGDPAAARTASIVPTFAEAAREVHRMNLPRWRNDHAATEWLSSLKRYAFDHFGNVPIDRITRGDVLAVLTPIWTTKPETARRVRQRMRKVFSWGTAYNYIADNPAGDAIDGALPSQPKVKAHQRALDYPAVPGALKLVAESKATPSAKTCLLFIVLTAARSGEARHATWNEFDVDARSWVIPGHRMKGGVEHRVPLSHQALDVLIDARSLDDGSGLAFPSPLRPGEALSWQCLLKILRTGGLDTTVHGFRSAFRTWALEQPGVAWATAEAALAHNLGNAVERAYIRSDLMDQRAELMQAWSDFCSTPAHGNT